MTALASTTATAMALEDSVVSTNTGTLCCGGGGGCFFTTLLQHDAVAGTEVGGSSMAMQRKREARSRQGVSVF